VGRFTATHWRAERCDRDRDHALHCVRDCIGVRDLGVGGFGAVAVEYGGWGFAGDVYVQLYDEFEWWAGGGGDGYDRRAGRDVQCDW